MIQYRPEIEPLEPYVPGKPIEDVMREYGLSNVVKLASNENPYGCSELAKKAAVDAMNITMLYPDGNCTVLRNALAKFYDVAPDRFVFGCGGDEIIAMISKVFVRPGDECITAAVTFSQYAAGAIAMGGEMVYSPMKDNGYDLDDILSRITSKTRIIFLTNPNNPTGTIFGDEEQQRFMEQVPPDVLVVFDEAYGEYVIDETYPDTVGLLDRYDNILYMKTFSKAYGLAGLRIGYCITSPAIVKMFEKIRLPFNVNLPSQYAAVAALNDREYTKKMSDLNREVMEYTYAELEKIGLDYIPSQGNFVMVDVGEDSRKIFVELQKRGYIIRAGAAFGMDSYLRITLGTREQMDGFFATLKEVLGK